MTTKRTNRGLLAGAAALYIVAAWMVTPGFYDGLTPATPYPFVCAPVIEGAHSSPAPGHASVRVTDAPTVYTNDGAFVISFPAGAFGSAVTVDITPVDPCPNAAGLTFVTNTYHVTAGASLLKPATLVMMYSQFKPDPSYVYRAQSLDGPWTNIGAGSQARLWTISATTSDLGYFAAGFPNGSISSGGAVPWLPIIVASLIAVVLLSGLPLAVRRAKAHRAS